MRLTLLTAAVATLTLGFASNASMAADDDKPQYTIKEVMKEAHKGGAWEWHQDFGYWYRTFLFPDLASCFIAVDPATRENGCLQVIKGSHRMGHIEHGRKGTQTGADTERVNAALEKLERVYVELDPGSAVFFHSNLLHYSEANRSPDPRWALICCYTAAWNLPFADRKRTPFTLLGKWPDERILEIGRRQWQELQAAVT